MPPPSPWRFPDITSLPADRELVATGADLEPGTLLAAYAAGLFPMPLRRGRIGWWSPEPRGIIPLDGLRVTRSLRKSATRYQIRVDTAFAEVIAACGDRRRPGAWIDSGVVAAYTRLHEMGWAHSVEAWDGEGLAGGLYGVALGGVFAGESMFHLRTDASKVALLGLVDRLRRGGGVLLDVQWATDHLRTLGAVEIGRADYHHLVAAAVRRPQLSLLG